MPAPFSPLLEAHRFLQREPGLLGVVGALCLVVLAGLAGRQPEPVLAA